MTEQAIRMARREFAAIGQRKVDHINSRRNNNPDDYINGITDYVMRYYSKADREEVYSAVESMFLGVEDETW